MLKDDGATGVAALPGIRSETRPSVAREVILRNSRPGRPIRVPDIARPGSAGLRNRRRAANLTGQRLSALLEKLLNLGWVTDGFDEASPDRPDRLPYYVLTDVGRRELTRP
ncbi:hypothetical protein CVV72_32420 [Amycolatopsis sp. TNS106]|nr:hypothetical protein CVV72_32420 [Amycolatopsis sp. TNS106]